MDLAELTSMVADLRNEGNDLTDIEVKRASGGFPSTVASTLSAFGNTPGGGVMIFGLDEDTRFSSVGVWDVAACKAALARVARQAVSPPVTFDRFRSSPCRCSPRHRTQEASREGVPTTWRSWSRP